MAINVNNFIVISETQVAETQPLPLEDRRSLRSFRSDIRRNVTQPDVTDADKPHVVVGGKAKKIGKTSAYMLDMLSLDD
jgi:hypothetical protein